MVASLLRRPVCIDLTDRVEPGRDGPGLNREQTLDRIMAMNPTATNEFLGEFDDESLAEYLDHLAAAAVPRGRHAVWVRPAGNFGIIAGNARG